MLIICAGLVCIYLLGFAASMRITDRDLDLSLAWPLIAPILIVRAAYVGLRYLIYIAREYQKQ